MKQDLKKAIENIISFATMAKDSHESIKLRYEKYNSAYETVKEFYEAKNCFYIQHNLPNKDYDELKPLLSKFKQEIEALKKDATMSEEKFIKNFCVEFYCCPEETEEY